MNGFKPTATQNFIRMTAANWAANIAALSGSGAPLVPNTLYMVWDNTALPAGGVPSFGTAATCGVSLYETDETGLKYWVASLSQSQLVTLIQAHASGGGTWGSITGTLSNQTDLQTALNGKMAIIGSPTNNAVLIDNGSGQAADSGVSIGSVSTAITQAGNAIPKVGSATNGHLALWTTGGVLLDGGPVPVDSNYANTDLTANASHTHTWNAFTLTENWSNGTNSLSNSTSATIWSKTFSNATAQTVFSGTPTIGQIYATSVSGANTGGIFFSGSGLNMIFSGSSDLRINGSPGTVGQVLTSNGTGNAPAWTTAAISAGTIIDFTSSSQVITSYASNAPTVRYNFTGTVDTAISLPAVSDGFRISISVDAASTAQLTLNANGAGTFFNMPGSLGSSSNPAQASVLMFAGEVAILEGRGGNLVKISGIFIPQTCTAIDPSTSFPMNAVDTAALVFSSGNSRMVFSGKMRVLRTGLHLFTAYSQFGITTINKLFIGFTGSVPLGASVTPVSTSDTNNHSGTLTAFEPSGFLLDYSTYSNSAGSFLSPGRTATLSELLQ